jgi:hypothetical protein
MRKSNEQSLSEILKQFAGKGKVHDKLTEAKLKSIWEEEMGPFIASRTIGISIFNGELKIKVNSSVLRQELYMARDSIKNRINTRVPEAEIRNVVVG